MATHKIIKAIVTDDGDYEYITDQGIHNTLKSIWKWADKNDVEINFVKSYADNFVHGLELNVQAVFKYKEDLALYKITIGSQPYNKLTMNNDIPLFIHE